MSYDHFLDFAHELANISGMKLRHYYRNFGAIQTKDDKSPVTIADEEAEKELRELIEQEYPNHGIIGEEHGHVRKSNEYIWVIDPIDGTASYIIGRPIFGTLIALLRNGEPVLGVIDQPITHERWIATQGKGLHFNNNIAKVRECEALQDAVLCTTSPTLFTPAQKQFFDAVATKTKQTIYGGDCYNYGLLASGHVDLVIEAGLKLHDFAALKVIVEEAGGIITDWDGKPLNAKSDGTVIAAASKALHHQALGLR